MCLSNKKIFQVERFLGMKPQISVEYYCKNVIIESINSLEFLSWIEDYKNENLKNKSKAKSNSNQKNIPETSINRKQSVLRILRGKEGAELVREFLSFNDDFYTESFTHIANLPKATRMEYLERYVQNLCCSIAIAAMGSVVLKTTNEKKNTNPVIFTIDPTILELDKKGNNQIQVRRFINE